MYTRRDVCYSRDRLVNHSHQVAVVAAPARARHKRRVRRVCSGRIVALIRVIAASVVLAAGAAAATQIRRQAACAGAGRNAEIAILNVNEMKRSAL